MPDAVTDEVVGRLRAEITRADAEIVAALNRRVALVTELHAHKRASGYEVLDPAREERVLADAAAANSGSLSDAGLREIYAVILPVCTREAARS